MSDREFTWDEDDPLARAPGETRKANDALRDYWGMGSGRSLRKLLERYQARPVNEDGTPVPPTRYWNTLGRWSHTYSWVARVDRQQEIENRAVRERWQERAEEWRETEFDTAQKLMERAGQMLQLFASQVLVPGNWKPSDVARLADVASKLARLAAEMETERSRQEMTGEDGGPLEIRVIYEDRDESAVDGQAEGAASETG